MAQSFSTALSGLRASSDALGVAGNNIANANTTAYKSNSITFADVFNSSIGARLNGAGTPLQIGSGVRTAAVNTDFSQGGVVDAGTPTSAAIQGNGFFVVADREGAQSYTRAGDFTIDKGGYLVTPGGQRVQGYTARNGEIVPGTATGDLRIPIGETMAPAATTNATIRMNLDSAAATNTQFHAPVQVHDSRGDAHTLDMTFTRQADGSYLMRATVDGDAAQTRVDGAASSAAPVAVRFDQNGRLTAPASLAIVADQTQLDGAVLPEVTINLRPNNEDGTPGAPVWTNYAAQSSIAPPVQDGYAAGTLTGLSLSTGAGGTIAAVFSNGQSRPIGQLALATFNAESGLRHLGGNLFTETPNSGQPAIGAPGSGGRGEIAGGALEQSNVDLATEFTNLIVAQRGFQANSRVITTINQTLQDLMQTI